MSRKIIAPALALALATSPLSSQADTTYDGYSLISGGVKTEIGPQQNLQGVYEEATRVIVNQADMLTNDEHRFRRGNIIRNVGVVKDSNGHVVGTCRIINLADDNSTPGMWGSLTDFFTRPAKLNERAFCFDNGDAEGTSHERLYTLDLSPPNQ